MLELGKTYIDNNDRQVEIIYKRNDIFIGITNDNHIQCYFSDGLCLSFDKQDDIRLSDEIPIDTKVLVAGNHFHYAGKNSRGQHCVWLDGKTSWTCDERIPVEDMEIAR